MRRTVQRVCAAYYLTVIISRPGPVPALAAEAAGPVCGPALSPSSGLPPATCLRPAGYIRSRHRGRGALRAELLSSRPPPCFGPVTARPAPCAGNKSRQEMAPGRAPPGLSESAACRSPIRPLPPAGRPRRPRSFVAGLVCVRPACSVFRPPAPGLTATAIVAVALRLPPLCCG